jgi:hypothetical protein
MKTARSHALRRGAQFFARVGILTLLAVTLATGALWFRPAAARAQARQPQTAGQQGEPALR